MKLLFFVLSTSGVEKSLYGRYYIFRERSSIMLVGLGNYNVTMTFARVTFVRVRILYMYRVHLFIEILRVFN